MAPETPKGVSSRLLSMKFMQRAAASAGSTPGSESDAPSSKKRKLAHDEQFSANIDQASIQAAIDERDAKRQAAVAKHGGNDTFWTLPTPIAKKQKGEKKQPLNVVYVGYGDIDPSDGEAEGVSKPARSSFNAPKAKSSNTYDALKDEDKDDDESGDDHGNENESPASRKSRSRSQSLEATKAKEFRDKRKKKDVQINKVTSISSAGAAQFSSPSNNKSMTCYTCNQTGHKASDCPQKKGSRGSSKRK